MGVGLRLKITSVPLKQTKITRKVLHSICQCANLICLMPLSSIKPEKAYSNSVTLFTTLFYPQNHNFNGKGEFLKIRLVS